MWLRVTSWKEKIEPLIHGPHTGTTWCGWFDWLWSCHRGTERFGQFKQPGGIAIVYWRMFLPQSHTKKHKEKKRKGKHKNSASLSKIACLGQVNATISYPHPGKQKNEDITALKYQRIHDVYLMIALVWTPVIILSHKAFFFNIFQRHASAHVFPTSARMTRANVYAYSPCDHYELFRVLLRLSRL